MNQCIYLGLGIAAFMVVWRFVVQKSLLDYYRDKLFDLREEVRAFFLKHESLEAHSYALMRGLLNGQIRYLDRASMVRLAAVQHYLEQNPEARAILTEESDIFYAETDPEVRKYLDSVRVRAYHYMVCYLVASCIPALLAACLMAPFYFGAKLTTRACRHAALNARSFNDALVDAMERVGTRISSQSYLEEEVMRSDAGATTADQKWFAGAGI